MSFFFLFEQNIIIYSNDVTTQLFCWQRNSFFYRFLCFSTLCTSRMFKSYNFQLGLKSKYVTMHSNTLHINDRIHLTDDVAIDFILLQLPVSVNCVIATSIMISLQHLRGNLVNNSGKWYKSLQLVAFVVLWLGRDFLLWVLSQEYENWLTNMNCCILCFLDPTCFRMRRW